MQINMGKSEVISPIVKSCMNIPPFVIKYYEGENVTATVFLDTPLRLFHNI